jgi:hypothetical protein
MPADLCPICGTPFDTASVAVGDDRAPREGDFSVCLYCGEVLQFGPPPDHRVVVAVHGWGKGLTDEQLSLILAVQTAARRLRAKTRVRLASS